MRTPLLAMRPRALQWAGYAVAGGLAVWGAGALRAADEAAPKTTEQTVYDPGGHRDPFVPLVRDGRLVGVAKPGGMTADRPVLYGILWDPDGRSIALINEMETKVGDTVAGYRVSEIRKDAVVLTNGGEPLVLMISFEPLPGASGDTTTGGEGP